MSASVSVVTVTLNNAAGLRVTLQSLSRLKHKPLEVLVLDGGSTDSTSRVVQDYASALPIVFTSEPDRGIYDAMNKGRRRVRGHLVHYLNAGDAVWGEPYQSLVGPSLLTVRILDETGRHLFDDFPKFGGYGYCHQGIVFPADHRPYDTSLRIAADLDLIVDTFPTGLRGLSIMRDGGAMFSLGGLSTVASARRDREVRGILWRRLPTQRAAPLIALLTLKNLIPRSIRRRLTSQALS